MKKKSLHFTFQKEFISQKALRQVISVNQHIYEFLLNSDCDNYFLDVKRKDGAEIDIEFEQNFQTQVFDQQIRIELQEEFGKIRESIVRFAFYPAEDIKE